VGDLCQVDPQLTAEIENRTGRARPVPCEHAARAGIGPRQTGQT
jgi:hypothetical protein